MNMTNEQVQNKLAELAQQSGPSTWRANVENRKRDRKWLRKSALVALKILEALDNKNMSKVDLANVLGVSRQRINEIVKGRENMTIQTMVALEDALGIVLLPERRAREEVDVAHVIPFELEADAVVYIHNTKIMAEEGVVTRLAFERQYLQEVTERYAFAG